MELGALWNECPCCLCQHCPGRLVCPSPGCPLSVAGVFLILNHRSLCEVSYFLREASILPGEVAKPPTLIIEPILWQNSPIRPLCWHMLSAAWLSRKPPGCCMCLAGWALLNSRSVITHNPAQSAPGNPVQPLK